MKRWRDHFSTMNGVVCRNVWVWFLKLEVALASSKGRVVKVCFPAWRDGEGWKIVAVFLDKFNGVASASQESGRG